MKKLKYYKIERYNLNGFLIMTYVLETFNHINKFYKTDKYIYNVTEIKEPKTKKNETLHSMPFYDFETFFVENEKEKKKKKKQELIDKFLYIAGVQLGSAEHIKMSKELENKTIPELKKMIKNI